MRIRTVKHIVKEGVVNAYRNKLMTLASVSIVIVSLIIFGVFYLIKLNIDINIGSLREQPEMQAFCVIDMTEEEEALVEEVVKGNTYIASYRKVTREEAFEQYKKLLDNDKELLEDYDKSIAPVSFIIKLKNTDDGESLYSQLLNTPGIEKIVFPLKDIKMVQKMTNWVDIVILMLLGIFLVIAMFIISNTIKLTVFARRREIGIMKYIGATDWFIRWPFIIEGLVIAVSGAFAAFILTSLGYNFIENYFNNDISADAMGTMRIVTLNEIKYNIIIAYIVISSFIGTIGSYISIRKHLHV